MSHYDILQIASESTAKHEGYRKHLYRCTQGYLTIGYGYNVDAGMPEDEAKVLLDYRLGKLYTQLCRKYPWIPNQPKEVQAVFVEMAYQLGFGGFGQFKNMLAAAQDKDYSTTAAEMRNSRWYKQTTNRAETLASKVESYAT